MLERLRTVVVVTAVTLIVWLYAEGQNLEVVRKSAMEVQLVTPPGSSLVVRRLNPEQTYRIEIEGPAGVMGDVSAELAKAIRAPIGSDPLPDSPGEHQVPVADVLKRLASMNSRGISVRSVEPPMIEYVVDRWQEAVLDVTVPSLFGVEVEGAITVSPSKVRVKVPQTLLGNVDPQRLRLVAVADADAIKRLPEGSVQSISAGLTLPDLQSSEGVQFEVQSVRLTFTVRSQRVTATLSTVPVHLVLPEVDQSRYDISLPSPFVSGVRLSGPSQLINSIESGEVPLFAYLVLGSDELSQGVTRKELSFDHWPAGLKVESGPHVVEVEISRRQP